MTYTSMVPYLKGIYLSLNSWRQGRDVEGWADQKRKRGCQGGNAHPDGNPPEWVETVPRLKSVLEALMELTSFKDPPRIPVHPTSSEATYIVGDAS